MPLAIINDLSLYYLLEGQGNPILWVSGLGQNHQAWRKQVPFFEDRFTCITFDNRDAGQSDEASRDYTIAEMAGDAQKLLEALGFSQAHVVGLSMGGAIAQELAIRFPERVLSLCLLSTYDRGDPRGTARLESWKLMKQRLTPEEYYRAIYPWTLTHEDYLVPGQVESYLADALANPYPQSQAAFERQACATGGFDASGRLAHIVAPTLIVMGDQDILTPLRFADALHRGIRGSRLRIISRAGHVMVLTHAQQVNKVIREFLQEVESLRG